MAYEGFDLNVSATRCLSRLALHPVVVLPNHEWIGNEKRRLRRLEGGSKGLAFGAQVKN